MYVFDIDLVEWSFKSVNIYQGGLVGTEGGDAADPELGLIVAGLTGRLHGDYAGHITGQSIGDVGSGCAEVVRH